MRRGIRQVRTGNRPHARRTARVPVVRHRPWRGTGHLGNGPGHPAAQCTRQGTARVGQPRGVRGNATALAARRSGSPAVRAQPATAQCTRPRRDASANGAVQAARCQRQRLSADAKGSAQTPTAQRTWKRPCGGAANGSAQTPRAQRRRQRLNAPGSGHAAARPTAPGNAATPDAATPQHAPYPAPWQRNKPRRAAMTTTTTQQPSAGPRTGRPSYAQLPRKQCRPRRTSRRTSRRASVADCDRTGANVSPGQGVCPEVPAGTPVAEGVAFRRGGG